MTVAVELCRFTQDSICIGAKCPMYKRCAVCSKTVDCEKLKAIYDKDMLPIQYDEAVIEVCRKCKEN